MKKLLLFIAACCIFQSAMAQKESAERHYFLYEYVQAIADYEKYLSKNPNDYKALKQLSDAYYKTNNIDKAVASYTQLIKMPEADKVDLLQLIQVLRMKGQLSEAKNYALQYKQKAPGQLADSLVYSIENPQNFINTQSDYSLTNLSNRVSGSVVSVQKWKDNQLLVTAEESRSDKSKWTGRSYNKLYLTTESFSRFESFAGEIMKKYDNGTPAFNSARNQMYFTVVNEQSLDERNVNTFKLKVVYSIFENGKWSATQDLPNDDKAYNTAYPTLSKDGKYLVFASDMPDGKGGYDLYYCSRNGDRWSQPVNMSAINTEGNEVFPAFFGDDLWFSSNGLPGVGGLDLFHVRFTDGATSEAINAKTPLNSSFDDYGIFSDDDFQSGYLISNREGDKRIDNVYKFEIKKKAVVAPKALKSLQVKVLDKYTSTPLPYVKVQILKDGEVYQKGMTDENGLVTIDDFPKGNYQIKGELNDITTTNGEVTLNDFEGNDPVITKTLLHNDPRFTLKGIVVNSKNNQPVSGVRVTCFNETLNISKKEETKEDGVFLFQLEQKSDFKVTGQKAKWLSSENIRETTKGLDRSKEIFVKLTLKMDEPEVNKSIRLDKIYYDYDKWNIRPASAEELDRVVQLMKDYPDMKIELSSHTDARGSDAYNEVLSQKRADAAVQYIIAKGITTDRIAAKGYGETRLLNRCGNGVACSEEEHQLNRRTEFKITECATCPK